jgi:hypothetical protein
METILERLNNFESQPVFSEIHKYTKTNKLGIPLLPSFQIGNYTKLKNMHPNVLGE